MSNNFLSGQCIFVLKKSYHPPWSPSQGGIGVSKDLNAPHLSTRFGANQVNLILLFLGPEVYQFLKLISFCDSNSMVEPIWMSIVPPDH